MSVGACEQRIDKQGKEEEKRGREITFYSSIQYTCNDC